MAVPLVGIRVTICKPQSQRLGFNPVYSINGIRAGATLAAARQRLPAGNLYHVGQNYWYLAPASAATAELKVRGGIVLGVGIADKRLTTGTKAQQVFVNSFS